MSRAAVLLSLVLAGASSGAATARPPFAPSSLVDALPAALREDARAVLGESDEAVRAQRAQRLARNSDPAVFPFLAALLAAEPSRMVRLAVVRQLGRSTAPGAQAPLEQAAAHDPDTAIAILALDRLRLLRMQEMRPLLADRIDRARRAGDSAALRAFALEQERWISLARGTMLPAFLRTPPPPFSLKPKDATVRVLAFGDFGDGGPSQRAVADAMLRYHRKEPFDFAVTLGDNFYPDGLPSPDDERWRTWWEEMYAPLGLRFWATLGNHDWGDPDSPAAEILRAQKSESWRLPAPYYTFTAGPVQFFALDTNEVSEAQLLWLAEALARSDARWKIVYGHHPIYSAGVHGDNEALKARLLPLLRHRVDVYLAGHDHDLQHLAPEDGVHFFVSGCAGRSLRPPTARPNSLFATAVNAFTVIDGDARQLRISYFDTTLELLYRYVLGERVRPAVSPAGTP